MDTLAVGEVTRNRPAPRPRISEEVENEDDDENENDWPPSIYEMGSKEKSRGSCLPRGAYQN
jgi:hypothetical protein